MPRPVAPSSSFSKPTLDTRFHIDYEWWDRSSQDLDLYLRQHLCEEHKREFEGGNPPDQEYDWIDLETGLVWKADALTYTLLSHCMSGSMETNDRMSLVDSVFRALLFAGNRPMTPVELAGRTGRPADVILRTLSGSAVYNGLRPAIAD